MGQQACFTNTDSIDYSLLLYIGLLLCTAPFPLKYPDMTPLRCTIKLLCQ